MAAGGTAPLSYNGRHGTIRKEEPVCGAARRKLPLTRKLTDEIEPDSPISAPF